MKYNDLKVCREINQSSKQILDHQLSKPMFLLKQFSGLSNHNRNHWINAFKLAKNSEKEKAICGFLQMNLNSGADMDLPIYTHAAIQEDLRKQIWKICKKWNRTKDNVKTLKTLAPLTENPNSYRKNTNPYHENEYGDGWSPIHWAAR